MSSSQVTQTIEVVEILVLFPLHADPIYSFVSVAPHTSLVESCRYAIHYVTTKYNITNNNHPNILIIYLLIIEAGIEI